MRFADTNELRGAEFVNVNMAGARFQNVDLSGARLKETMLVNAKISGLIVGLTVNDVAVGPLIDAELTRRYPERAKLRPDTADGVREAWAVVEGLWSATKARAAALDETLLDERVDDEWSFLETVRHLVFVTDGWISGNVLGREGHWHPLGLAPSFITDITPFGHDVDADPSFAEVVAAREDRMGIVRTLVAGLADDDLAQQRGDNTTRECLLTLFDEEWHHNWFANRDLDVLVSANRA